jgi:AraC-like DNA-binding protein
MNRTSSSTWVRGVLDMFASQGVDVPRLLQCTGVDPAGLDAPGARMTADTVTRMWDLAVAWSGNPALGLERELVSRFVNFDVVGHAMLSSPDLRAGLDNLARYLALISDAATFTLVPERTGTWLVLGHTGNTLRVPRQRQEYGMLSLLTLCQWLTRRSVQALAVEFAFPDPVSEVPYRQAFDCRLRFGQPATRLLLSDADLATPLPSRSPAMLALHERVMDEQLSSLGAASLGQRVREYVLQRLDQGEPRREDVATHLALTDRTFQRRLHAENTSFQQVLDDARCELARKYLAQEQLPLAELADRLGFVDPSNLFRACKRWFGVSPGAYRKRLSQSQGTPASMVQ